MAERYVSGWTLAPGAGQPVVGRARARRGPARDRELRKELCAHAARRVVVHAVAGGHRAHCLRCGTVGPVREGPEDARQAVAAGAGPSRGESQGGSRGGDRGERRPGLEEDGDGVSGG